MLAPSRANMEAPPRAVFQACSEMGNCVSSVILPLLRSRKTSSAVISLTTEAGAVGSSAALSNSTAPVPTSITSARGAVVVTD